MALLAAVAVAAAWTPSGTAAAVGAPRLQMGASAGTNVAAWGYNASGQLGDGTQTSHSTPVAVAGAGQCFTKVASGADHSVGIAADGTVWTWGGNAQGQLGDGTMEDRSTPVQVLGLSNVTKIAAGSRYTLALRSDGTVWSWGSNHVGQLGLGHSGDPQRRPRGVLLPGPIVDISAGTSHSLAVRFDGQVWSWGANYYGQLGDATVINRPAPVRVASLTDAVRVVAAQGQFSLAMRSGGTVSSWGLNTSGQLGDGTNVDRLTPVPIFGLSNITDIAAGTQYGLAVDGNGTLFTWGNNSHGVLGDGTTLHRWEPQEVPGLSGVVQAGAGSWFSTALRSDGTVWSWGWNIHGQLGDGTDAAQHLPVQVLGLENVTQIASGPKQGWHSGSHTLAIRAVPTC
jgi:alpha-tubulin suppressor-like RCC1 family protein